MDTATTPLIGDALHSTVDLFIGFGSDLFTFLVIVALLGAFAFYFGRDRLAPLVAGIYAAIPLYAAYPYFDMLKGNPYLMIAVFAVMTFVAMVAFTGASSYMAGGGVGFLKTLALALITGLLISAVALNVLPVKDLHTFSAPTLALFNHQYFFWWLLAPIAGVFLFGK